MRTLLIVGSLAVLASPPAYAGFLDGNELYKTCSNGKNPNAEFHFQDSAQCTGYVEGVADTSSVGNCLPERVKAGQITDVAIAYLASHPAKRHLDASYLVELALREGFCTN